MLILLDRKTFEPALPNMTMTSVMLVIAADMSRQEPLHKRAECFRCFGLYHEMEVVGHQAKTEKDHRMFGLGRGKQVKESAVVSFFVEDDCAAISPIDDMVCETGDLSAWDARHGEKISQEEKQKQRKSSLSPFPFPYFYDGVGKLNRLTDSSAGDIAFEYEFLLGRLHKETTLLGTVEYSYDAINRRTSIAINGQQPITYSYDAASRPTEIIQGSEVVNIGYDAIGRRTNLAYTNGTTTLYGYDLASRLTSLVHQGPTSILESLVYGYDAAGNRIDYSRGGKIATLLPDPMQAGYDLDNEQVQFNNDTPNYAYDANGNLISESQPSGSVTYTWDARNRLVGISGPGISDRFSYDALGRRVGKNINGVATSYLYDGVDVIAEIGASAVSASYLRAQRVDEPFIRRGSELEYYHTDALGSTLSLTGPDGNVSTTYFYDPFGNTTVSGPSTNPFQYTGRENDGTGLYYYRARYYSPQLERFISPDPLLCRAMNFPITSVMRNPQTLNPFAYVNNSPLTMRDPLGLSPECEYYDQRCEEVTSVTITTGEAAFWYCVVSKRVCEKTPRTPLFNCIRQCLQIADRNVCSNLPTGRKDRFGLATKCYLVPAHSACFTVCGIMSVLND